MPIVCTDCTEKDDEIYKLKEKLSEWHTILVKVKIIIGALAAATQDHILRETRTKLYEEINDALSRGR